MAAAQRMVPAAPPPKRPRITSSTTRSSRCASAPWTCAAAGSTGGPAAAVKATHSMTNLQPGYLVSDMNATVPPAREGEVAPLHLGCGVPPLWPPLVLAPMAGLTSAPLRVMCAEAGASLCVSEMILAHELIARNAKTLHLAQFHPSEAVRSAQLYAVDPNAACEAARILVEEHGVKHVDMNYGCPVRKVTARGGGAALPLRPRLFARLVAAAVAGARGGAAVTVKLRIGLARDPKDLVYFLEAARIAEAEGASAVTLHARTADQLYSPPADWMAIRELVQAVNIPVIGNGDVFEAADAMRMIRETGCAGVMIGRGCLGRPWLFSEAAAMLSGDPTAWPPPPPPSLSGILTIAARHAAALAEWEGDERAAVLQMRKLVGCYLAGFDRPALKARLHAAERVFDWEVAARDCGGQGDEEDAPFPVAALRLPRLKGGGTDGRPAKQRVSLPVGWLEGRDEEGVPDYLTGDACEG